MNKIIFLLCILLFSFNLSASERVSGTQITIEPPKFLEPSTQFPGYIDAEYGTSIMVTEIPGSITEVSKGMEPKVLMSQGATFLSSENIKLGKINAKLIKFSQPAYDTEFVKWAVLFGNQTKSVLVAASFQKELSESLSEKLKKSLLTVRWVQDYKVDLYEGLIFRIKENDKLKVAKKINNALLLTSDGVFPITNKNAPYSIIAPSYSTTYDIHDYKKDAKERLLQTKEFSGIEIIEQRETEINGLEAQVLLAKGVDNKTKTTKFIHFSILYAGKSYYIIQSTSELNERSDIENYFDKLLNSFIEV